MPKFTNRNSSLVIYKIKGTNQYYLKTFGQEMSFTREEDAQRFARYLTKSDMQFDVQLV